MANRWPRRANGNFRGAKEEKVGAEHDTKFSVFKVDFVQTGRSFFVSLFLALQQLIDRFRRFVTSFQFALCSLQIPHPRSTKNSKKTSQTRDSAENEAKKTSTSYAASSTPAPSTEPPCLGRTCTRTLIRGLWPPLYLGKWPRRSADLRCRSPPRNLVPFLRKNCLQLYISPPPLAVYSAEL